MIILWSQLKDRWWPPSVTLSLVLVLVSRKASASEFMAFYLELHGFMDRREGHESTVRGADEAVRVVNIFDWTGGSFEFSVVK